MNVLDLFSGGAGGWTLGLHRAGYRTVAACEADEWRRNVFAARWGIPVCPDVRELTAAWFRASTGIDRPFLICGSPPCKEYSAINHRGGGLDADDLFLEAVRIVGELRPDWVAFENSPLIRTRGYDRIAHELEAIDFAGWPLVVGVANAGAAHRRARIWLVCRNRLSADSAGAQGRPAGQPRPPAGIPADCDRTGLWIEQGRRRGPDGQEAPISFEPSAILGPVGSRRLGEHLRKYDGVPSGISELCRSAYGDAVSPIIPEIIGRAIMAAAQ